MIKREPLETQDRLQVQRAHGTTLALTVLFDELPFALELPSHGTVVLGRDESADVVLPLASVSREHARIDLDGERATVLDLDSRNGTTVNGEPIPEDGRVLEQGDEIGLGDATVVLFRRSSLPPPVRPLLVAKALEAQVRGAIVERSQVTLYVIQTEEAFYKETLLLEVLAQAPAHASVGVLNQRAVAIISPDSAVDAWIRQRIADLSLPFGMASTNEHQGTAEAFAAAFTDLVERTRAKSEQLIAEPSALDPTDAGMREVFTYAERVAATTMPVLLVGETGTGKEVFARHIHRLSGRTGPLICVNTAALPETLVESELFGHERGAFSGASQAKSGLIEAANRGTLFLDEIGELPLGMQAKLLRVLEDHVVRRVGATSERRVDIRVIAATHRVLEEAVAEKRFRQDLLFRLNAATIELPPLRNRPGEVARLAQQFLLEIGYRANAAPLALDPAALELLNKYQFPGNVRELRNLIERAVALAKGSTVGVDDLPAHVVRAVSSEASPGAGVRGGDSVRASLKDFEKQRLVEALEKTGYNQTKAAELLGLPRRTLAYKMGKFGLLPERDK